MKTKFLAMIVGATLLAVGLLLAGYERRAAAGPLDDLRDTLDKVEKAKEEVDKYKEPAQELVGAFQPWSYPEERSTGRVLAARVAASFGGVWRDEHWTNYVNLVGRGLVPYCNRPDIKYRFAILATEDINAYSCPGGYIFITKGLLRQLSSEAQLAGVLAHEIAHVSQRHIEKEVKKQQGLGAMLKAGLTYARSSGQLTAEEVELVKLLSEASWEILIKKGLSKQDEYEADRVGTENLYRMGYNPYGLYQVLEKLQGLTGSGSRMQILLSTHPPVDKRLTELEKEIRNRGYNTSRPERAERWRDFLQKHPL